MAVCTAQSSSAGTGLSLGDYRIQLGDAKKFPPADRLRCRLRTIVGGAMVFELDKKAP